MKKILSLLAIAVSANAFAWQPEQPIKLYVGNPVGGNGDLIARVLAEGFAKRNVNVVVINKPGANGALAVNAVAQAKPDGYSLLMTQTVMMFGEVMTPAATDGVSLLNSFEHVAPVGVADSYVFANSSTVEGNFEQVIEDTRTGRKNYTWGATFAGAALVIKQIEERVGRPLTLVSYQGRPPAIVDFLGGRLDILVDAGLSVMTQHEQDGKVRFLASANKNVTSGPSIDKVLPGIYLPSWSGVSMPAGAPPEVVKYYHTMIGEIVRDPASQEKFKQLGIKPTHESLKNLVATDIKRFKPIADKQLRN